MKTSKRALVAAFGLLVGALPIQSQNSPSLPPTVLGAQYFPSGVFDIQRPSARDNWYACTLRELNEPSLFALRNDKSAQVYRFLWIPSFHRPISVRLTINIDGTGSVVTRSVDSHAGLLTKPASDMGKLIQDTATVIDQEQVKDVVEQLQRLSFWSMPTEKEQLTRPRSKSGSGSTVLLPIHLDGSQWILEGLRGGEYHVVDRWSPRDDSYSELCKHLLHLGKVETALY